MIRDLARLSTLFIASSLLPASAELVFNFDYTGSTEFNDPVLGEARKTSLEDAAGSLAKIFDHTATIDIKVTSSIDPEGFTLASATSSFVDAPAGFTGFTPAVVMRKVQTGTDDNGAAHDGKLDVNFGFPWDLDDAISPVEFDFKSTIIHELFHTLGFTSDVQRDGTDVYGNLPGTPGIWLPFDEFLSDKNGTALINPATFAISGSSWNSLSTGGTSPSAGLFFNGPNATEANGGSPVGLYSPESWEEGSSGSHLDDWNLAQFGLLMLASLDTGQSRRSLSDIERGILEDIGYKLLPLPSPTLALLEISGSNSVSLELTGPEYRWYAIEYSSDIITWNEIQPDQTMEQVWFCGAHTDVGGGYLEDDLSKIALRWMTEKAVSHQLLLYDKNILSLTENPDGHLHDSRGGKLSRFFRKKERYWPQKDGNGKPRGQPDIHPSVLKRTLGRDNKTQGYKPWIFKHVDPVRTKE